MKKAYKISELISELNQMKEIKGDLEVFVADEDNVCFYGISKLFVITSASDSKSYLSLLAGGDILKI